MAPPRPTSFEARFAGRLRMTDQSVSLHLLDVHPDRPAARQADLPGRVVGDPIRASRFARIDHVDRLGHHRAFDAAPRDRAEECPPGRSPGSTRPAAAPSPRSRPPSPAPRPCRLCARLRQPQDVLVACQSFHVSLRLPHAPLCMHIYHAGISRHPPQPLLRIARMAASRRQRSGQLGHEVEVMDRPEHRNASPLQRPMRLVFSRSLPTCSLVAPQCGQTGPCGQSRPRRTGTGGFLRCGNVRLKRTGCMAYLLDHAHSTHRGWERQVKHCRSVDFSLHRSRSVLAREHEKRPSAPIAQASRGHISRHWWSFEERRDVRHRPKEACGKLSARPLGLKSGM